MSGLFQAMAVSFSALAILVWGGVVLLAPRGRARVALSPRQRATHARAWLYAPLWLPGVLLGAALLPGLVSSLAKLGSHCLDHCLSATTAIHHHLCLVHASHPSEGMLFMALPLTLLGVVAVILARTMSRAVRRVRLIDALVATSEESEYGDEVRVLDQAEPMAFAIGLRARVILISRGLLEAISPRVREVVLAHERAHLARRDTVLAMCDDIAAAMLPPSIAHALLDEIELAREQACDELAAQTIGSRIEVAQALAQIARLRMRHTHVGFSIAASALEARIVHLLDPPRESRGWMFGAAALLLLLLVLGAWPTHFALEQALHTILH